jgi:hypothetical protein
MLYPIEVAAKAALKKKERLKFNKPLRFRKHFLPFKSQGATETTPRN